MYEIIKQSNDENNLLSFTLPYPQTAIFADLQTEQGFKVEKFIIKNDQDIPEIIGFFQIVIYPLVSNKTSIYIPYGPVLAETNSELVSAVTDFLMQLGKDKNAVFVRTDFTPTLGTHPSIYKKIKPFAYKTAYHQPRGEWLLDITPESDVLLSQMHKKTRYNINKSLRTGLNTQFYSGKDISAWVGTFIALNEQNTASHQTTTHPKEYFKTFFELASKDQQNFIAVTRKEGHVLAINIFIQTRDTVFCPFGASNDLGKKLGAYYHIKWTSILYMKDHGVKTFNWGGVSVRMNDDHLLGVTKFKTGFGGQEIKHGELHDLIIKPFWYHIYMLRKFLKK